MGIVIRTRNSSYRGIRVIRVRVNRVKMTEKLETQFELAGKFELSEFELPGFYCSIF